MLNDDDALITNSDNKPSYCKQIMSVTASGRKSCYTKLHSTALK